jgi:hypothetical protein
MKKLFCLVFLVCMCLGGGSRFAQSEPAPSVANPSPDQEEENLNVFQQWIRWNNPGSLLIKHLIKQAFDYYEKRDQEITKLKTAGDWQSRQKWVKSKLLKVVGPFPEKTPLRPRITGVLQKEGYRVEKVIYESMPEFYVTGCLFVPDRIEGKAPAILNVIGHNQEAFRAELYQILIHNLVKRGDYRIRHRSTGAGRACPVF